MDILRRIPYWAVLALLAYMPFHIFLAQSLSLATGGLEVWKAAKDVILATVVLFTICLVWFQRRGTKAFWWLTTAGAAYFLLHILLWAFNQDLYQKTAILGTVYNTRLPAFAVLGYGAMLLYPGKFVFSSILKLLLGVSTVVAALGVIQYFLPSDLLTHLGYGLERGTRAAFFIEDNPDLPRVMSTLREPNVLGAYLVLPAAALLVLLTRPKEARVRLMLIFALLLHLAAIFLTFSRSAWLGVFLALALAGWWQYKHMFAAALKRFWPVLAALAVALMAVAFAARDTAVFQRYISHSEPTEQVADLDSNDLHIQLAKQGAEGIAEQPLGHGPGTAGIVSIQNPAGGQLTENYYLQIGYELGILGLTLFVAINAWLYLKIWRRGDYMAVILCVSFWAYVLINMLLHSWSNEAVAAQWWILAGMALAVTVSSRASKKI